MRRVLALTLLFLAATNVSAQVEIGGGGVDSGPKVTISGALHKRAGDDVEGIITAKIADTWHINSNTPSDEFLIPTTLTLDEATATLTNAQYPQHQTKTFAFSAGKPLAVYEGEIFIPFTAKLKSGATAINAIVNYQACNDNVCLAPRDATATIDATKLVAPPANPNFTPLSAAPKGAKATTGDRIVDTFASKGLPLTLVLLFLGGLALNLTPCVFPLIPITLGFFSMQSDGRRSRRFLLSLMYVLGIVITYSVLGVAAALSGKILGAWLQLPAVLIGFAILMLILASSMFGAFEIQPPKWIANRSSGRTGLAGALTMGLLIGIVAAPCVGPVVISLITLVAQLGDPVRGGLMFATLAFGLGLPYLVALNALPRPGAWMVTVKKAMGFVLIAMAFYFLRPLTGDEVMRWGIAGSLLIGAGFLLFSREQVGKAMRYGVAVLLLAGGVYFAWPKATVASVIWNKYDSKALAAASAANKPVIIDFYADWCLPCKELDQKTFTDPRVIAEMNRFIRVKADLTAPDDAQTQALTKQYAIMGVPTIVFLDASGKEVQSLRLTGFERADKFLARLKSVK